LWFGSPVKRRGVGGSRCGSLRCDTVGVSEPAAYFVVLADVLKRAMLTNAMLFLIFVGATGFAYVFRSLGGDYLFEEIVTQVGLGPWSSLFIMMPIILCLGFSLEWIGITLFHMKGIVPKSVLMTDIYKGIVPFVLLQLVGLGLVIAFPQIALWLPNLVFD
jgi:TRAP-type mannitol/chloroaromatic compound transport system permease large subunit